MSVLTQEKAIIAFKALGKKLAHPADVLGDAIYQVQNNNAWFTIENIERSILSFSDMLNDEDVHQWFQTVNFTSSPKKVGLILAGNIPMVGFHDVLCVLATGNIALI